MAFEPVAGVLAAFKVGAESFAMDKWEAMYQANMVDVTNFTSEGFQNIVAGKVKGTVTVSGPYDSSGVDAWAVGDPYDVICSWNGTINLTLTGLLKSIKSTQDIDGAGRKELVFESDGVFTAEIE